MFQKTKGSTQQQQNKKDGNKNNSKKKANKIMNNINKLTMQ